MISVIRAEGRASRTNFILLGVSRGAVVAGLIGSRGSGITALVLISGVYDMCTYAKDGTPSAAMRHVLNAIIEETGGGQAALDARSSMHVADRSKARALIISGGNDDRPDPERAKFLAIRINENGGDSRAIPLEGHGHKVAVEVRNISVDPFINLVLLGGTAR